MDRVGHFRVSQDLTEVTEDTTSTPAWSKTLTTQENKHPRAAQLSEALRTHSCASTSSALEVLAGIDGYTL